MSDQPAKDHPTQAHLWPLRLDVSDPFPRCLLCGGPREKVEGQPCDPPSGNLYADRLDPPPLIGITGYRRAGKDSIANVLERVVGYHRAAFGDAVKAELFDMFGMAILSRISGNHIHKQADEPRVYPVNLTGWHEFIDDHKHDAPTDRYGWVVPMLQTWATEYRRNRCDQAYWVKKILRCMVPGYVISDVRYTNEAAAVRAAGGYIWRVVHPTRKPKPSDHSSDTDIADSIVDVVIHNDMDLAALDRAVLWEYRALRRDIAEHISIHSSSVTMMGS